MSAVQGGLYRVARDLGLVRLIGASLWESPAMPEETRTEGMLLTTSVRGVDAQIAEGRERATDDALLAAEPLLGDLPLVVLVAEKHMTADPYWTESQGQQAALSTNGRLIVATGSGHYIHWEQPALVIDAVRQVVTDVRSR